VGEKGEDEPSVQEVALLLIEEMKKLGESMLVLRNEIEQFNLLQKRMLEVDMGVPPSEDPSEDPA